MKTTSKSATILILLLTMSSCSKNLINTIISKDASLQEVCKDTKEYEVQIRYTQIDRDNNGRPTFKAYEYNVDPNFYFYPASTVKMPIAFLALQRVHELAKESGKPLDMHTPIYHFATRSPQSDCVVDELTEKAPTIANYVDQIFCVSDNNAYNRLFELLGQEYINKELYRIGAFTTSRINHRVGASGFSSEDNEYINEVQFKNQKRELLYRQAGKKSTFTNKVVIKDQYKGRGYQDSNDSIVMQPFDFSKKNYFSINDLEACMQRVLFPEAFTEKQRFDFTKDDYVFLKRSMSILPRDIPYFANDNHYYDNYVKFYYDGDSTAVIPPNIKIYNKVGWAYGYLTDCSYIVDTDANVEFMLTSTIKVNKNGIFNDGVYEYDSVGLPFFRKLGKSVLEYERSRKKK